MLREARKILGVLVVQVLPEDLVAHRIQSLLSLVAPGVQEGPIQVLPLDPLGLVCQEALVGLVLLQNVGHNIRH